MKQTNWFDRKFDFSNPQNIMPSIIERLEGTPLRLQEKLKSIHPALYAMKPEGQWSILEQIGHLADLEALWQTRLHDILTGKPEMHAADLENTQTHRAGHNTKTAATLIAAFRQLRAETLHQLRQLSESDLFKTSLHPRLKTPMRLMDLFLFVAEHDDHHLAAITTLAEMLMQTHPGIGPAHKGQILLSSALASQEIIPGFSGRFVHTDNMTLVYWEVQPDSILPQHAHLHEQVTMITEGEFELSVNGETSVLVPGMVAVIPSMALHSARALTYCEITDVFYPLRTDYV